MSGYGFEQQNPSGGLVISSDGFGLNYLGKAAFVQDEAAPDLNALFGAGGGIRPTIMRYRIVTASPVVVPFLALSSRSCGVVSVVQSGTQWDFVVFNQDGGNAAAAIEIFCFGRPTTQSDYGMWLFNAAEQLSYEFGSARPLMFSGVIQMGSGVTSAAIPGGLVKPAVMGFNLGWVDPAWVVTNPQRGQWRADAFVQGWALSGTVLARSERRFRQGTNIFEFEVGESPGNEDCRGRPVVAYLIDANGLN